METDLQFQCEICLKLVGTNECQILDGTLLEFFETLLIKLNLDCTATVCICFDCEEKVNKAFNFKCTCIGTEDTITSYFSAEKIDLKRILCDREKHEHIYYDVSLDVCRLCQNFVSCSSVASLEQILEDESIKEIFQKHIPEVNLEATENPSICQGCQESLIIFANLLFLLFDYKDRTEPKTNRKQKYTENKESILKKVKRETDSDYSKIKMECRESDFDESMEYEIKEEMENNIEQTELQLKMEEPDDITHDIEESSGSEDEINLGLGSSEVPKNTPPTYKCCDCSYQTTSLSLLIEHTRGHTQQHKTQLSAVTTGSDVLFYKCKVCGFSTSQHYLLQLHLKDHLSTTKNQGSLLKNRQERNLEVNQTNDNLNPKTNEKLKLTNVINQNARVILNNNGTTEKAEPILKQSHNQPVVKKYGIEKINKCPECSFGTDSSSKFWAHLLTHPNYYFKKVVPSVDEKKQTKSVVFIGRTTGATPWKKMFKCELCHFKGSSHQDFMNHVLVHVKLSKKKKKVPYQHCIVETIHYCELCDFRTLSLDELKVHIEVHMQV